MQIKVIMSTVLVTNNTIYIFSCSKRDCFDNLKLNFCSKRSGPGCSKLTTSLVNVSFKFQTLISNICQYFLLKKCMKLLQKLLSFFQQKISVYLVIKL